MKILPFKGVGDTLKFRMIIIAVCVHLSIWFVAVVFSSWTAVNVIFDALDDELETQATFVEFNSRLFIELVANMELPLSADIALESFVASDKLGWEGNPMVYWTIDQQQIYRTGNAPALSVPTEAGFFDETIIQNGRETRWRIYYQRVDEIFWLAVAADTREARQAAIQVGIKALYPMVLIMPLTILGIYWSSARGLRPLARVAAEVESRSPTSLEPVDDEDLYEELKPLVGALNGLLKRLSGALENEHRFTANAAHELQTPLTAIKAEVQMRQRGVTDPEINEMLWSIRSRVDRAVYTVRQLLILARLESQDATLPRTELNLHQIVQEALADHAHEAVARELVIDFPEQGQWPVKGQRDSLAIMAGNLLANAFRYTLHGGKVAIDGEMVEGAFEFRVANDSEVMSDAQRKQLIDRFYRKPGTDSPGAGLGLSIVQHIAALHGAEMSVTAWQDGAGLCVTLRFS